jgi:hypothetical protein
MSEVKREWAYSTDTGEESRWRINNHTDVELPTPIKDMSNIQSNQFVEDGDLWTKCD